MSSAFGISTRSQDWLRSAYDWYKVKKAHRMGIDSYNAIFPEIRSQDEVPSYVNALTEYFPGGLPFSLFVVFKPTAIKAKKQGPFYKTLIDS